MMRRRSALLLAMPRRHGGGLPWLAPVGAVWHFDRPMTARGASESNVANGVVLRTRFEDE